MSTNISCSVVLVLVLVLVLVRLITRCRPAICLSREGTPPVHQVDINLRLMATKLLSR